MAELTERFIKLGRYIGYSGTDLHTFVREEREREREEQEKKEKEKGKKEREREERRLKKEAEEQERQGQLQLAKINADIEMPRATKPKLNDSSHEFLSKVHKMAPLSESKGDTMDAFIFRFEMLVKSYDWSDDTKFLALSNLLIGGSLRVLQTLLLEQQNYNCLKQALLKKFLCTASNYNA